MFRMSLRLGFPAKTFIGNNSELRGSSAESHSLATIFTSLRTSLTNFSKANPSREPMGWLAIMTKRPLTGMLSIACDE